MAVFLNQERTKLGTTTGTIIAFPRELDVNDPQLGLSLTLLPSGYLRCDGSIYNSNTYPALAEILGTGDACAFKQEGITLNDTQFQVPDLRSKFIKASSGSDQGVINDSTVVSRTGLTIDRSGVAISATSNVGTTVNIDLSGQFRIPPLSVDLRGNVGFTKPRAPDVEIVPATAFQPHAHYTTTYRCRIKRAGGSDVFELNYYTNASTIGVGNWFDATGEQPACKFYAQSETWNSGAYTSGGTGTTFEYYGICKGSCSGFITSCLVPTGKSYPVNTTPEGPCYVNVILLGRFQMGCAASSRTVSANYVEGAEGVGDDNIPQSGSNGYSHNSSLRNVLPFDTAIDGTTPAYPQVSNIVETTEAFDYEEDPTEHTHTISYTITPTAYTLNTNEFFVSTDGMSATVNVQPETDTKLDGLIAPFIMVDFLIKA
jgi:microcystin-dependent protein